MTHPIVATRAALTSQLAEVLPEYDVLNGFGKEYAKSAAVIVGDMTAVIDRDRFTTGQALPFTEEWELTLSIMPSGVEYSVAESHALIADLADKIILYCASNYTLGIPEIVRCQPSSLDSIADEQLQVAGSLTLSIIFRIDRRIA